MSIRILYVDDHVNIRQIVRRVYEFYEEGVEVELFDNAPAALAQIKRGDPFDVILLDYQMPPGNEGGVWAAKQIKRFSPQLPIIFVSAFTDPYHLRTASQAGALAYISKEVVTREETAMSIIHRNWPNLQRLAGAGDNGVWFFYE